MSVATPAVAPSAPRAVTRRELLTRVLVLGSLTALGPLTIDLYLPAFPAIADNLAVAESAVQLTLTGTLLGIALGQLIIGPMSDVLGRRRPLVTAVVVHVVASLICAVAPTIQVLGAARVLQGMAASAGAVVSMAVVRDLYTGLPAVRLLSQLMLVTGVAPVLAPSLGGWILGFTDWRGVFWVLAALGVLLIGVVVFGLAETLPPERRRATGVGPTMRAYAALTTDRRFLGLLLTGAFMMGALFAYIAASSFVFQGLYGLTAQQYGLMFGVNSIGLVIAVQVNARVVRRVRATSVLAGATGVAVVATAWMVVAAATGVGGFAGVAAPLFVMLSCVGFTMPNVPVLALADHGSSAGTAAAMLGASNFVFGAVVAPVVGAFGTGSAVPMAAVMLAGTMLASVAFWTLARATAPAPGGETAGEPVGEPVAPRVGDAVTRPA